MFKVAITLLLVINSLNALAETPLKTQRVADNVYAIVGEMDQRTPDNYANNATFGFVVTPGGTLLIDSGGSYLGARQIDNAIHSITDKPVKIVINTGGQDHRWWGNGYFKQKGAHIITSSAALDDQKERTDEQYTALNRFLGKNIKHTKAVYADETFDDSMKLKFGGENFLLVYTGPARWSTT